MGKFKRRFDGIKGVIVTNREGLPISTTYETDYTEKIAIKVNLLIEKAVDLIKELEKGPIHDLKIETNTGNICIGVGEEYIITVVKEKKKVIDEELEEEYRVAGFQGVFIIDSDGIATLTIYNPNQTKKISDNIISVIDHIRNLLGELEEGPIDYITIYSLRGDIIIVLKKGKIGLLVRVS